MQGIVENGIYISLILFLLIGIIFKDKPKTIKEYAIGSRRGFSKTVLVATMLTTLVGGGSTIGKVLMYYNNGLLYIIPSLAGIAGYILFVNIILPRT